MAVYKRNNVWFIDYYIKVMGKEKREENLLAQEEMKPRLV